MWDKLIRPADRLIDDEARANSRLLAILLIAVIPAGILVSTVPYFFGLEFSLVKALNFKIVSASLLLWLITYSLNRTGYFKISLFFAVSVAFLVIFAEVVNNTNLNAIAFLLLPLLIINVFFPLKYVLSMLIVDIIGIILLPFLFPKFTLGEIISSSAAFISFGGILLIITKIHASNLQNRRDDALKASELRYALISEAVNDGVWDWDLKTNTIYFSPRWKEMLGYQDHEIENVPEEWMRRIHPDDLETVLQELSCFFDKEVQTFNFEYRLKHKDGHDVWVQIQGRSVFDENDIPVRTIGSHSDITSRKNEEEKLQHDVFHDALTGLPNRMLLLNRLQRAIHVSERDKDYRYAVLFLDLDNFKDINDTLGHDAGDRVLIECAHRLQSCARKADIVARLGGDEFVILLENFDNSNDPIIVAKRISDELVKPLQILQTKISLTASIGITYNGPLYTTADALLKDADIAMYQAKDTGRARYQIFDPQMEQEVKGRIERERDLVQAIKNNNFRLVFQPIVSLETGEIFSMEALVRWHHPQRGIIPAVDFISIAEESGHILELSNWVLTEACKQIKNWDQSFPQAKKLSISVNISGKQIENPDFCNFLIHTLQETKLEAKRLHLEITENTIVEDVEQALHVLTEISALGVELHLDNFGTGLSSIAYLHHFPITGLKIDKSFIARLIDQDKEQALVGGIIHLANLLGLDVVAEGIERSDQLSLLKELHCGQGQGFYAAKPMSKEDMELFLAKGKNFFDLNK